jgi:CBS domain-containing protein
MVMSKTVREVLGERRSKFSVPSNLSIRETVEYMHENHRAAVAVCDGDTVVGVFSERDLLRRIVRKRLDMDTSVVGESMSSPVYYVSLDERCEVAKAVMVKRGLHHLVVLNERQEFQGFISSRELLEADLLNSQELVGKLNDDYYEHQFKP